MADATTTGRVRSLAAASGWVAHGLANVIVLDLVRPIQSLTTRLVHHAIDLGRHALLAALAAVLVTLWIRRIGPALVPALWVMTPLCAALGWVVLADDMLPPSRKLAQSIGVGVTPVHVLTTIGVAQVVTFAWLLARWLAPRRGGAVALLVAAAAVYGVNVVVYPMRLPGVHLTLVFTTVMLLSGSALAVLRRRTDALTRAFEQRARIPRIAAAVGLVVGIAAVVVPLRRATALEMSRWGPTLGSPLLGSTVAVVPDPPELDADEIEAGFYADRSARPAIPPTRPRLTTKAPIVLLITVDALRADLLTDAGLADQFPTLHRLMAQGTHFTVARSASAATVVSLATVSTGKYFSQLRWTEYETDDWLPQDPSMHFPQRLAAAGVTTWVIPGAQWQDDRFGMMRGFDRGRYKPTKGKFTHAKQLTASIERVLRAHDAATPLFLYCHYFDPHHPYTRGKVKTGTPYERYVSEVALVDRYLAHVWSTLKKRGLLEQTYLILAADHGEAFGEHGVEQMHAVNLYEELVRVPLVVVGPGVLQQTIDEPVSLVDLGPTILDLFDVPTPGDAMGQSLVPWLAGKRPPLIRPLVIEGLQKQALVSRDGIKVIRDQQTGTVEIYDLAVDPDELVNLSDDLDLRTQPQYARLHAFFEAHTYRADGYVHPRR